VPTLAESAEKPRVIRLVSASREEKSGEESFMPVEITGGWVRAEKGIGGRIVLGVVCAGVETPAS